MPIVLNEHVLCIVRLLGRQSVPKVWKKSRNENRAANILTKKAQIDDNGWGMGLEKNSVERNDDSRMRSVDAKAAFLLKSYRTVTMIWVPCQCPILLHGKKRRFQRGTLREKPRISPAAKPRGSNIG
jgi:hypothetical protein